MAKGNTFKNDLLKLLFQAVAIANLADNAATSPLTSLYFALHTADPGAAGSQSTSEAAYTNYARVAVARTNGGFTVTGDTVALAAAIDFAQSNSAGADVTHWSVGTASTGAGKILYSGTIGAASLGPFTAATTGSITIPGLTGGAVNDKIAFNSFPGSTLPTGMTEGQIYFVKTVSADVITIATTQGGTALTFSASGDGVAAKINPISPVVGVTPRLTTGLTIVEG